MLASATPPIHLTPATRDLRVASDWFRRFEGAGLDGVMAKPIAGAYQSDKRVMFKVKHERDCDCVVAGFRWHKGSQAPRSAHFCSGLFDDEGVLQHVGVCASFTQDKRRQLVEYLAPYRRDALANHPWKQWAEHDGSQRERSSDAGRSEPLEPWQGLIVGTATTRAGGRGGVRAHAGRALSSHVAVSKMAGRQEPEGLHLCATGGGAPQELMEIFAQGR